MTSFDFVVKRLFDLTFATIGLVMFGWLIILAFLIASIETRSNGFFRQTRVGKNGKLFKILKIKTMNQHLRLISTITVSGDPRITRFGKVFRRLKIDELPQLYNVLIGKMSFIGPRPDVPGYADQLNGADRMILRLRPGISGPASYYYRNEELVLSKQADPKYYNDAVIWPTKVIINKDYLINYSLRYDIMLLFATISPLFRKEVDSRLNSIIMKKK